MVCGNQIVFPTADDIDRIAKELKLTVAQVSALQTAVGSISGFAEQILDLRVKRLPYRGRLKRAKGIENALGRLRDELTRNEAFLADLLPRDVGKFLFQSLTFTAISKATGQNRFPEEHHLIRVIIKAELEGRLTVQALEADLRRRHRTLGREHGHVMFRSIVDSLHESFRHWVALQRFNEGGAHPKWVRALVLDQLIKASNSIIGKPATSAPEGKFADLCRAVLPAFGLTTEGVEKAIYPAIQRRKFVRTRTRRPKAVRTRNQG